MEVRTAAVVPKSPVFGDLTDYMPLHPLNDLNRIYQLNAIFIGCV